MAEAVREMLSSFFDAEVTSIFIRFSILSCVKSGAGFCAQRWGAERTMIMPVRATSARLKKKRNGCSDGYFMQSLPNGLFKHPWGRRLPPATRESLYRKGLGKISG